MVDVIPKSENRSCSEVCEQANKPSERNFTDMHFFPNESNRYD